MEKHGCVSCGCELKEEGVFTFIVATSSSNYYLELCGDCYEKELSNETDDQ